MPTKAQGQPSRRKNACKSAVPRTAKAPRTMIRPNAPTASLMPPDASTVAVPPTEPSQPLIARSRPKPGSKLGLVLGLLETPEGVRLAQLVEATGWLPHTTRAALTGLRKRGFAIVNEKTAGGDRASIYRLRPEAA